MKEIIGDLWDYKDKGYIVITTNGIVNAQDECVMGRGTALQAKTRFKGLAKRIGDNIRLHGNHVDLFLTAEGVKIITFPVKHHWAEKADISLIKRSIKELVDLVVNECGEKSLIFMPRPGCGNGGLNWEAIKPILQRYLNKRFIVVERP